MCTPPCREPTVVSSTHSLGPSSPSAAACSCWQVARSRARVWGLASGRRWEIRTSCGEEVSEGACEASSPTAAASAAVGEGARGWFVLPGKDSSMGGPAWGSGASASSCSDRDLNTWGSPRLLGCAGHLHHPRLMYSGATGPFQAERCGWQLWPSQRAGCPGPLAAQIGLTPHLLGPNGCLRVLVMPETPGCARGPLTSATRVRFAR